jgi:hypothetical protein
MLTITVEKDEIGPFVELMATRATDMSVPISNVARAELDEARQTINSGGAGFGWAPTSPWTLAIDEVLGRARQGQLNASGTLAASLGDVFEVSPYEGIVGTSSPVARYQQEGTSTSFLLLQALRSGGVKHGYGGRGIPPRPFLFWHQEKLPQYDDIFMDYLTGEGEGNA